MRGRQEGDVKGLHTDPRHPPQQTGSWACTRENCTPGPREHPHVAVCSSSVHNGPKLEPQSGPPVARDKCPAVHPASATLLNAKRHQP